jgi:hypothetical protein
MTADREPALDVDEIETSALGRDKVVVRVVGRWRGRRRAPDARAFLVVESDGRRHRFPAMPEPRRGGRGLLGRPGQWGASFAVPAWLEPGLGGEMSLWVGDAMIPLDESAVTPVPDALPADLNPRSVLALEPTSAGSDPELVPDFDAESEAQLRGLLADTRAELEARVSHQEQLESALAELRSELVELANASVEREAELGDLRAELGKSTVAREAAESEAAGLRSEIDRLGGELAAARGSVDASAGLREAQLLLEEARALTSRLRAHGAPPAGD